MDWDFVRCSHALPWTVQQTLDHIECLTNFVSDCLHVYTLNVLPLTLSGQHIQIRRVTEEEVRRTGDRKLAAENRPFIRDTCTPGGMLGECLAHVYHTAL